MKLPAPTPIEHQRIRRSQRRMRRTELESRGISPAQRSWIFRVETTVLAMPKWAIAHSHPDLALTPDIVWLSDRKLAYLVCRMDRENGGKPTMDKMEMRRCRNCGALRLGVHARHRRELDESKPDGWKLPCSAECGRR